MGMRGSIWADRCTKRETRALPRSTTAGRSSSIPTAWSRSSTSAWRSKTCACPTRRSSPTAPRSRLTRVARTLTTTSRSSTRRAVKGRRRCATCARTASWCRREGARRDERVHLQGVARNLLSGGPSLEEDARVLRGAVRQRRDQLLLLPEAHVEDPRGLGGASAGAVPLRAQGLAEDHAPEAAARVRGSGGIVRGCSADPEQPPGAGAVSAPSELQGGPAALARFPPPAPTRSARGLRVPPRELVRGRDVHGAARRRRGALHSGERGPGNAPGADRGLRLPAFAAPRLR